MFVSAIVLAAGGSTRLGQPKQLLAFRGRTLLDAALDTARACAFDQIVVALGGAASEVRERVDLSGCEVVDSVHHTDGCSSSIVAALEAVDPHADVLVLLLGDQPDIDPASVDALLALGDVPIAVCRYRDGPGHPFLFARAVFAALAELQGDKAVWKLLESARWPVAEVDCPGPVPLDVDTWDDYQRLLENVG
ncbi:MAG: nucleotidyltransferase family protein [Acidimicrobiia bacterium]|nr:nucleotidyltransferase family protein [Acidimicrobiia bacterium]